MPKLFSIISLLLLSATTFGADVPGDAKGMALASNVSDSRLQAAASAEGWSLAKAKTLAAKDKSLHITPSDRFFYACKFNAAGLKSSDVLGLKIQTGPDTSIFTGTPQAVNATTAFQLHSRPGAAKVLYLDFKGHTTPVSASWGNATPIVIPAFKLPGTATATDQLNLNAIRDIWLHVSEDYAAWDIDVTTEVPASTARGQRCVIGGNVNTDFASHFSPVEDYTGVMGISLMNFGGLINGTDANNFVFLSDGIPSGSPTTSNYEITILCVAHEVGHTFGLEHWGETASGTGWAYTFGHTVSGFTGVANTCPIMGSSELNGWPSACNLNHWSKGDYPYSVVYFGNDNTAPTGTQDDLALISSKVTKLVGANDDHGDTLATATLISGATITAGGIIASSTDVDLMKITALPGPLSLTATPHLKYRNLNGNLKIGLSLLNSAGTTVATAYPTNSLGASLSYTVPSAGNYYIKVNGVGYDPTKTGPNQVWTNTGITGTVVGTSAGFTNYGSLGRYGLTGNWSALPNVVPVAVITANKSIGRAPVTLGFSGTGSTDADGIVSSYAWNFGDPSSSTNTSTLATPSHTFAAPGTYTVTLQVKDNGGDASLVASKVITATGVLPAEVKIGSMTPTWSVANSYQGIATADIAVVDQYGDPLRNVLVYVTVSGLVNGKASAKSDATGHVYISCPKMGKTLTGTINFTVTSLVLKGYPWLTTHDTGNPCVLIR